MKLRFLLTALCLCLGLSAMAQRHGNRQNRGGNPGPQSLDMVVDTAIINSMELDPEIVAAVLELQATKADELKARLIQMASQRKEGQQITPEEIANMRNQIEEFKFEYRMRLRKILGVENYINYLERLVDKRPVAGVPGAAGGFGGGMPRRGNWSGAQAPGGQVPGGQIPGGQGGWGGQQGGWGGGNEAFGGNGGFGDDRDR